MAYDRADFWLAGRVRGPLLVERCCWRCMSQAPRTHQSLLRMGQSPWQELAQAQGLVLGQHTREQQQQQQQRRAVSLYMHRHAAA